MAKTTIKNANACYTGGNIYIYYGQLEDGTFFRACDDWECIEICDADTSTEEADYCEFYEEHTIKSLGGKEYETFWNDMLLWIIHNAPDGNYSAHELEKRILLEDAEKQCFTIFNSDDNSVYGYLINTTSEKAEHAVEAINKETEKHLYYVEGYFE